MIITVLTGLILIIGVCLFVPAIRKSTISRLFFNYFKRALPPISATEREAINAGDTWWEADLFQGRPDWQK